MGELLEPGSWCRQKWCRENPESEHEPGDGCSCHPHGAEPDPEQVEPAEPPHPLRLTSKAWRLDAFACRSCGVKTRNMVEYPKLFLRCEPCATLERWPSSWAGRIPRA